MAALVADCAEVQLAGGLRGVLMLRHRDEYAELLEGHGRRLHRQHGRCQSGHRDEDGGSEAEQQRTQPSGASCEMAVQEPMAASAMVNRKVVAVPAVALRSAGIETEPFQPRQAAKPSTNHGIGTFASSGTSP